MTLAPAEGGGGRMRARPPHWRKGFGPCGRRGRRQPPQKGPATSAHPPTHPPTTTTPRPRQPTDLPSPRHDPRGAPPTCSTAAHRRRQYRDRRATAVAGDLMGPRHRRGRATLAEPPPRRGRPPHPTRAFPRPRPPDGCHATRGVHTPAAGWRRSRRHGSSSSSRGQQQQQHVPVGVGGG